MKNYPLFPIPCIDAHVHLADERLFPQLSAVLLQSEKSGISGMINCATRLDDWDRVLSISQLHPHITPALGIHPWHTATHQTEHLHGLHDHLCAHPAALVGEIGLDRTKNDFPVQQEHLFREQIDLAIALNRPFIIHCVHAWGRLLDVLRTYRSIPIPFMLHACSCSPELVPELTRLGAYFSFSGSLNNPSRTRLHKTAISIPEHRLLIETDAPERGPNSSTSQKMLTYPGSLPLTARKLARLRAQSLADTIQLTTENATRFIQNNP